MATQTTQSSLDELAKGLANGTLSRGKAIRWMGGALLGAALASVPGVAWANDCRRLGRECRRDSQCCSRNCVRRGDDKVCGCPQGQSRCGDRCVNRERNENHCGECFNRCEPGEECVDGECQSGCPPVACVGGMVNPDTCECECAPPKTLMGGQCVCPAGQLPVCDFSGEIPQPTGRCEPIACPPPRPALCAESGQVCCGRVNNQN
jgi:hypothetical protein